MISILYSAVKAETVAIVIKIDEFWIYNDRFCI